MATESLGEKVDEWSNGINVKEVRAFEGRRKRNDLKTTMYPNSRLLCTAMYKRKTASEKTVEGFVTCGLYPSLALDPPRAAVGI